MTVNSSMNELDPIPQRSTPLIRYENRQKKQKDQKEESSAFSEVKLNINTDKTQNQYPIERNVPIKPRTLIASP